MTENAFAEKFYTVAQVLQMLDVARHRFNYLFDSRRLKAEEFLKLPNGQKVYRAADIQKIKKALFEVSQK